MSSPDTRPGIDPANILVREPTEKLSQGGIALITGGSRGIGRATALALVSQGIARDVLIQSTPGSQDRAVTVLDELAELGAGAKWFGMDFSVGRPDEIGTAVIDAVVENVGVPDVLILNAGIRRDGLFVLMGYDEAWSPVMRVNLEVPAFTAKAAIAQMMRKRSDREPGGRIVLVSSLAAHGSPGQAPYAVAKAGLGALAETIAQEYAARNIGATALELPLVETDFVDSLSEEQLEAILGATGMPRALGAQEAGLLVAAFARPEPPLPGAVITMDKPTIELVLGYEISEVAADS